MALSLKGNINRKQISLKQHFLLLKKGSIDLLSPVLRRLKSSLLLYYAYKSTKGYIEWHISNSLSTLAGYE